MAQSTCLVNMNHIEVLHTTDFKFDIMLPAPRCDLYPKIESPT